MSIATVIYHRADFDGIVSGAIMRKALTVGEFKPTMIGWDYGDPIPEVDMGTDLYMVDISVEGLMDHPHLTWIDHHKTAIDKWHRESLPGFRIDGVAACRLCWQFINCVYPTKEQFIAREVEEPLLVRLAGEYDIWDKRDPRAELLQFGLRANEFGIWAPVDDDGWTEGMVELGKPIQAYSKITRAEVAKKMTYVRTWHGLTFCILNGGGSSLHFEGADMAGIDALMNWKHDGHKVTVSMYHAPGQEHHDLSAIAKDMGGGGHRGACGFTLKNLSDLEPILGRADD